LHVVVSAGFVRIDDSIYLSTKKCRELLKRYKNFHELYAKAEELLETLGCEHEQRRLSCVKDVCLVLVALVGVQNRS